ncbi:hypothetical protein JZ751_020788 [Albula glossodonta]|uniref:Uncharacterized protein n=1 Tax=Albula glossodonta TaxID=121402 RepID=A0A8T2PIP9_9TELE|nr:hypothetical protein JZ751_020788 [Albula glossodonta]
MARANPAATRSGSDSLSERRGEPSFSEPRSELAAGDPGGDSSSEPSERLFLLPLSDCSESEWAGRLLFTGRSLPESSSSEFWERRGLPASLPERFLSSSDSLSEAMRFRPSSSEEESEDEMMALDLILPFRDGGMRSGLACSQKEQKNTESEEDKAMVGVRGRLGLMIGVGPSEWAGSWYNLCKLDPRLHIVRILLCHLLEMAL